MTTIEAYDLRPNRNPNAFQLPFGTRILSVVADGDMIKVFAIVNTKEQRLHNVYFHVFTSEMDAAGMRCEQFLGTVLVHNTYCHIFYTAGFGVE